MKVLALAALSALILSVSDCGSKWPETGGLLGAARTEQLYGLAEAATPLEGATDAFVTKLMDSTTGCAAGTVTLDEAGDCDAGSWTLTGTVSCTAETVGAVTTLTVLTADATALSLYECGTTVSSVSGVASTEVLLTGQVKPFRFDATSIITVDESDPASPVTTLDGSMTRQYNNVQMEGGLLARISYQFLADFSATDPVVGDAICTEKSVSAAENNMSGNCTIQVSCSDCL